MRYSKIILLKSMLFIKFQIHDWVKRETHIKLYFFSTFCCWCVKQSKSNSSGRGLNGKHVVIGYVYVYVYIFLFRWCLKCKFIFDILNDSKEKVETLENLVCYKMKFKWSLALDCKSHSNCIVIPKTPRSASLSASFTVPMMSGNIPSRTIIFLCFLIDIQLAWNFRMRKMTSCEILIHPNVSDCHINY